MLQTYCLQKFQKLQFWPEEWSPIVECALSTNWKCMEPITTFVRNVKSNLIARNSWWSIISFHIWNVMIVTISSQEKTIWQCTIHLRKAYVTFEARHFVIAENLFFKKLLLTGLMSSYVINVGVGLSSNCSVNFCNLKSLSPHNYNQHRCF